MSMPHYQTECYAKVWLEISCHWTHKGEGGGGGGGGAYLAVQGDKPCLGGGWEGRGGSVAVQGDKPCFGWLRTRKRELVALI